LLAAIAGQRLEASGEGRPATGLGDVSRGHDDQDADRVAQGDVRAPGGSAVPVTVVVSVEQMFGAGTVI